MMKFFSLTLILGFLFLTTMFNTIVVAAISATPKYLFLDPSRRSVAINVTNDGTEDDELWVETKFGYVTSDDTGGIHVIFDSTDTGQQSAASWIRAYPPRFVLGPEETQIVRLVVSPPAGISPGEYWARVNISSKPRKPAVTTKGTNFASGMILVSQVGLAFHYRLGSLNTGVQLNDLKTSTTDTSLDVLMKLTRIGSASFWGTRVVRLVSESGKVVYSTTKEIVVYKTLTVRERINRKKIPTGTYRLETEFITGNRKDVENTSLIQAQPLRVSNPVTVP